jgi:hypothetical protein
MTSYQIPQPVTTHPPPRRGIQNPRLTQPASKQSSILLANLPNPLLPSILRRTEDIAVLEHNICVELANFSTASTGYTLAL